VPTPTPSSKPDSPPSHESHCMRRNWFGFCKEWSAMSTLTQPSKPDSPPSYCVRRNWFGFCKEWTTTYEWRDEI
jgi:hypothetical protein